MHGPDWPASTRKGGFRSPKELRAGIRGQRKAGTPFADHESPAGRVAHWMVSVTVVECDVAPLVPVTVMVRVPVVARRFTVIRRVDDPAPVIDVGVKLVVTRLPCPEADSAMAELKPPVTAVLTVTLPELPRRIVTAVGLALME